MNERKTSKLHPAADVLQRLLQSSKSPLGQQFIRWRVWQFWRNIVGPEMAQHSAPVGYYRGCLYIWVKHASWMQEMTFLVRSIQAKVNEFVGYRWASSIRFTLDRKSVPDAAQADPEWQNVLGATAPVGGDQERD